MDKFRDRAVENVLYEQQRGGDIELMLERGVTNSRVNEAMAKVLASAEPLMHYWKGKYQDLLSPVMQHWEDLYLNMEGYARKQAIELKNAEAPKNWDAAEPEKKRKGLLGLLPGGS